jgi:hypothetical protein
MSKLKRDTASVSPSPRPTGSFYTVAKDSHLLYCAYRVDVVDGVVTKLTCLSRAPDLLASAVGYAQSELWTSARTQHAEDLA